MLSPLLDKHLPDSKEDLPYLLRCLINRLSGRVGMRISQKPGMTLCKAFPKGRSVILSDAVSDDAAKHQPAARRDT